MQDQAAQALAKAVRGGGSIQTVLALLSSDRFANEVDRVNSMGTNALHLAVWRNHLELVEALLVAGAKPDEEDKESGWTPLHRALYFGNLRIAAALLAADASLTLPDWAGRLPLDLLSQELKAFLPSSGPGEVYVWGNGNNYTLGTGSTDLQVIPARIDSLHGASVVSLSAAKFHSAAVTADGELWTWGWGRGGRLGHPEAHIHSGESAVISPRLVAGLGKRQVVAVAAAKHHTLLCTTSGEAYTFGRNRHGQLGYAGDTQAEPRRVAALRSRIVAVAAANKHSVAVSASGDVFTWGANDKGQLGYGTFDSTTSATPRLVEALKGRDIVVAAAAKRHTVVLTADGDVFTWGHRGVSPRRVQLAGARDAAAADGRPLQFHRGHADVTRPEAVAVCAGAAHSSVLTSAGVVLTWRSADPVLVVQEVGGALAGRRVVALSAGKYRTAAVTEEGDVYSWEGRSDFFPADGRKSGSGSKNGQVVVKGVRGRDGCAIPMAPKIGSDNGGSPIMSSSPAGASYGSLGSSSRPKGSFLERIYALKREGDGNGGGGPASLSARPDTPRSLARASMLAADSFARIIPERVMGLKRAAAVAVGEKHSLALQRWSAAQLEALAPLPWLVQSSNSLLVDSDDILGTPRDVESDAEGNETSTTPSPAKLASLGTAENTLDDQANATGPPSLQLLCEEIVGRHLVDPRTALQVLEYADLAGASALRAHCLSVAICNLDTVLIEARGAFEELPPHLLSLLERVLKAQMRSNGRALPASEEANGSVGLKPQSGVSGLQEGGSKAPTKRRQIVVGSVLQPGQRPTAAASRLGDLSEGDEEGGASDSHGSPATAALRFNLKTGEGGGGFVNSLTAQVEEAARRLHRTLNKKLQQIQLLEERAAGGEGLDPQQLAKVAQRPVVMSALLALEGGMHPEDVQALLQAASTSQEQAVGGPSSSSTPQSAGASNGGNGKGSSKTKSRQRLPSETSVLAAEMSATTMMGSSPLATGSKSLGGSTGASLLAAACSPPTHRQVPAFGSAEPMTHIVGFAASSASKAAVAEGRSGASASGGGGDGRSSGGRPAVQRKGGLSMFLRGELDKPADTQGIAAGPSSSSPGVAWGKQPITAAADVPLAPSPLLSMKEILNEQQASATGGGTPRGPQGSTSKSKKGGDGSLRSSGGESVPMRVPLSAFLGAPSTATAQSAAVPAWNASTPAGVSPPGAHKPSLRQIQEEQEYRRKASAAAPLWGASPPTTRPPIAGGVPSPWSSASRAPSGAAGGGGGGSGALLGSSPSSGSGTIVLGSSPSGRVFAVSAPPQSKWYLSEDQEHEQRRRKSLKAIQAEEKAMKELARRYGNSNVRIVKPGVPQTSAKH